MCLYIKTLNLKIQQSKWIEIILKILGTSAFHAHVSIVKLWVWCSRSATYIRKCLELLLKLDVVLTLISKVNAHMGHIVN